MPPTSSNLMVPLPRLVWSKSCQQWNAVFGQFSSFAPVGMKSIPTGVPLSSTWHLVVMLSVVVTPPAIGIGADNVKACWLSSWPAATADAPAVGGM